MKKLGIVILVVTLLVGVAMAALIQMDSRHAPPCVSLGLVGFTNVGGQSYIVLRITNEGEEAISLESGAGGPRYRGEIETIHGWTAANPVVFTGAPTLLLPTSNLTFRAHLPNEARRVRFGVGYQSATLRQKLAGSAAGRWIPRPLLKLVPGSQGYEYAVWTRPLPFRKPSPDSARTNPDR
jgi:hypothetical protein